jgi:hypothetical protein
MKRGTAISIALIGLLVGSGIVAARTMSSRAHDRARAAANTVRFAGSNVHAPSGTRVTVEVFNTTRVHGLGRRASLYLRDQGFDVVTLGTAAGPRDTTLVVARSGHPEWAQLVARALGSARTASRPDSSRDVDVSVFLGASWRPPPQPFYP